MTREEYLHFKSSRDFHIIYNFYMEKFDQSKHKPFLSIVQLLQYLPQWGNLQVIFEDVCDYYDNKFEIVEVKDREGNTIKCL